MCGVCYVAIVPAAAPEIGIGSFKSVSTGENTRQVEIYWQVRTPAEITSLFSFRQPHSGTSSSISHSPISLPITSSSSDSPLCTSITPSLFH